MKRIVCAAVVAFVVGLSAHAAKIRVGEEIATVLDSARAVVPLEAVRPEKGFERVPVWSETLHHPKATYVAPHFSHFRLAEGDYLIVRSPDGRQVWRYTGLGRADRGLSESGFWSGHIKGDSAIVELYATTTGGDYGIQIDRYARGYNAAEVDLANDLDPPRIENICGTDDTLEAKCYQDDEPQVYGRSNAVARLLIDGTSGCSGWLVGCEGHLMTNAHCIASQEEAENTDFEFMAEGASCDTDCRAWGACPGVVEATSASLVQSNALLDYALVLLPENLTDKYGGLLLREEGPILGEAIYIPQHPAYWGKRIAVESTESPDGLCRVETLDDNSCSGGGPDIGYHCDSQGGSSGSPVLGYSDHRVVGLHHCGGCLNTAANIVDVIEDLGTDLPACAFNQPLGTLVLDRSIYTCADTVEIRLQDDSIIGAGTQVVEVGSSTESPPEAIALIEGPPGVFTAQLPTTSDLVVTGDGRLSLGHADEVFVHYIDADDGSGGTDVLVEAVAVADCLAPAITRVDASEVTGTTATVTWDTDEDSNSVVEHAASVLDETMVRNHRVRLTGLAECSTHDFGVRSTDLAGNVAVDDNGGSNYEFATGKNTRLEIYGADTPMVIPDDDFGGVASTITVVDDRLVQDVDVIVDIDHPYSRDLGLVLVTPSGYPITLADRLEVDGADFAETLFDDEAQSAITEGSPPFRGAFRPMQPLSLVDGYSAAGVWQLWVADLASPDAGVLRSWRLILRYPEQLCGPHAAYAISATENDACPSGDGDGDGVWDGGEQVAFSVGLRNDGDTPLSAVTARVVPLTPGVQMIEDSAGYDDLPVFGETDGQSQAFVAQLSSGLDCADELRFELAISANEGSWSETFSRVVGLPSQLAEIRLHETFDSGAIPQDWRVIDGPQGGGWFLDDPNDPSGCASADPRPPIDGGWAAVDSDCAGAVDLDEQLISPQIDLSAAESVGLSFDHYLNHFGSELADVDVRSALTSGAWVNVARFTEDSANPERVELDLSPFAAGAPDVEIRWRYHNANFDWFWHVDNVSVTAGWTGSCSTNVCSAAAVPPTPIPDGSGTTEPMRVGREDAAGTRLRIQYDDSCAAASTHLLFGPLDQVAGYSLAGSLCEVASPAVWDPAAAGDLWFLLVGADGAATESSWGESTEGERNGIAASGLCGVTVKDLSGACP